MSVRMEGIHDDLLEVMGQVEMPQGGDGACVSDEISTLSPRYAMFSPDNFENSVDHGHIPQLTPDILNWQTLLRILRDENREMIARVESSCRGNREAIEEMRRDLLTVRAEIRETVRAEIRETVGTEIREIKEEIRQIKVDNRGMLEELRREMRVDHEESMAKFRDSCEHDRVRTETELTARQEVMEDSVRQVLDCQGELRKQTNSIVAELTTAKEGLAKVRDRSVALENTMVGCQGEIAQQNKKFSELKSELIGEMKQREVEVQDELISIRGQFKATLSYMGDKLAEHEKKILEHQQSRSAGNETAHWEHVGAQVIRLGHPYRDRDVPRFRGEKEEHPKKHIEWLREFFEVNECSPGEQLVIAKKSVVGKCENWLKLREGNITCYGDFETEFLREYWDARTQGSDRADLYRGSCRVGKMESHLSRVVERSKFYDHPLAESDIIMLVYSQTPLTTQRMLVGKEINTIEQLRKVLQEMDRIGDIDNESTATRADTQYNRLASDMRAQQQGYHSYQRQDRARGYVEGGRYQRNHGQGETGDQRVEVVRSWRNGTSTTRDATEHAGNVAGREARNRGTNQRDSGGPTIDARNQGGQVNQSHVNGTRQGNPGNGVSRPV